MKRYLISNRFPCVAQKTVSWTVCDETEVESKE